MSGWSPIVESALAGLVASDQPRPCAFDPEGCRGHLGSTGSGRAACACGWRDAIESPDRPAAFARWLGHTRSVPSHREQLAARMAEDERRPSPGHEES